ncbi:MAG: hypothetical protein R3D83_05800 [Caenibius sp.]
MGRPDICYGAGAAQKLKRRFREVLGDRPLIVLGIPDDYEFMQPELIALLEEKVPPFLAAFTS